MSLKKLLLGLFVASALVGSAAAQQPAAGSGRYDQQIQDDVTKIIGSKDKWKDVKATTEDGIVTLEGTVKVFIDKADLARKVQRSAHAEGVRNHIEVAGNVPDAELQDKLADKLRYDRVGYGVMFNALGLKVQNGVVTISGDVHDYPSRDSAIAIVETTAGVKDVVDEINVLPESPFDDELRIRIARAIYGSPSMRKYAMDPQKPIRIIVDHGHVTLYGVVDSQLDKQIAETQAKSVPGAFSIDDQLVISGQKNK